MNSEPRRRLTRLRNWAGRHCQALLHPDSDHDNQRMLEAFFATGHLYGIDYGNIDPAWYRAG